MYKSDVATNIRSSDWEVLGKNDVFFDRSSGRKGDSHGRLFFCQIRTGSFSKEFRCCSARNKFRTGALPRIFNYSTEHSHLTGMLLSFSSLKIKKTPWFSSEKKWIALIFSSRLKSRTPQRTRPRNLFLTGHLILTVCHSFQQSSSFSQLAYHLELIFSGKNTHQDIFFYRTSTEHLPVADFEIYNAFWKQFIRDKYRTKFTAAWKMVLKFHLTYVSFCYLWSQPTSCNNH